MHRINVGLYKLLSGHTSYTCLSGGFHSLFARRAIGPIGKYHITIATPISQCRKMNLKIHSPAFHIKIPEGCHP